MEDRRPTPPTLPQLERQLEKLRRQAAASPRRLTLRTFYREDGDRLVLDHDAVDEYFERRPGP